MDKRKMISVDARSNAKLINMEANRMSNMNIKKRAASGFDSAFSGNPARDTGNQYRHIWVVTGPAGCGKTTVAKKLAEKFKIPYLEGDDYHPQSNIEKMSAGIALTDADRWDWLITLRDAAVDSLTPYATSPPSSPATPAMTTTHPGFTPPPSSPSLLPSAANALPVPETITPSLPSAAPASKPSPQHLTVDTAAGPGGKRPKYPHHGVVVTCSALKKKYRDVIRVAAYNDHGVHVHFLFLSCSEEELTRRVAQRTGHYMGAGMVRSQFLSLEEPDVGETGRDVVTVDCTGKEDVEEVQREVVRRVKQVLRRERDAALQQQEQADEEEVVEGDEE